MKNILPIIISACLCYACACENREINPGTGPKFSEIHDSLEYHFDRIQIDGLEYFILERDRNNPHEGFGFMALNGAKFANNQDTIKAYLKTVMEVQTQILSQLNNEPRATSKERIESILEKHLDSTIEVHKKDSVSRKVPAVQ
jgi:hypothetical protein